MYVPKSEFGWNRRTGWLHGDEASYNNAVALMKTVPPGRQRIRPVHPSWSEVLKCFDSSNVLRSQGAFCRWAGLNRATFSAMQCKPLLSHIELWIGEWLYIGDGQGLDGSMNTNQDQVQCKSFGEKLRRVKEKEAQNG